MTRKHRIQCLSLKWFRLKLKFSLENVTTKAPFPSVYTKTHSTFWFCNGTLISVYRGCCVLIFLHLFFLKTQTIVNSFIEIIPGYILLNIFLLFSFLHYESNGNNTNVSVGINKITGFISCCQELRSINLGRLNCLAVEHRNGGCGQVWKGMGMWSLQHQFNNFVRNNLWVNFSLFLFHTFHLYILHSNIFVTLYLFSLSIISIIFIGSFSEIRIKEKFDL